MASELAVLLFQAHANYGTWCIDFYKYCETLAWVVVGLNVNFVTLGKGGTQMDCLRGVVCIILGGGPGGTGRGYIMS